MKIFYSDHFVLPLPADHGFPMAKYALLRQRIMASELGRENTLAVAEAASDEQLLRAHGPGYLERVKTGALTDTEVRRIGFPWSPQLVERSRRSAGGTIAACRGALEEAFAVNLAGGTHHASRDAGEGFCVFNDAAVAARAMQAEHRTDGRARVERVIVLDCDVHQGNGTASIFADDPSVYTFSIHGANNFPFRKQESDLDIALPDGAGDEEYLEALESGIESALCASRADLAIYLAGADPFAGDTLGRLRLSKEGLARRDRLVYERCRAAAIPVATVMGGGYAPEVDDIVDIHLETVSIASEFARAEADGPRTSSPRRDQAGALKKASPERGRLSPDDAPPGLSPTAADP